MALGWFAKSATKRNETAASGVPDGPLRRFLSTPPPSLDTPVAQLPLLAIDLETTGLDAENDHMLSAAWVPIDDGAVHLGGARHLLIRGSEVGQSAVFHQLTDDELAGGMELADVLDEVLDAMAGRILLAHHASVEMTFLTNAIMRVHNIKVTFTSLDTMLLARAIIAPGFDDEVRGDQLRLWRMRNRYNLPAYKSHEALTDAIACAELYLAEIAELGDALTYKKLAKLARA